MSLLLPLTVAAAILAQEPPVLRHTFAEGTEGWMGIGPSSVVGTTQDKDLIGELGAALQHRYAVKKGEMNALIHTLAVGQLKDAASFQFRVRSDAGTVLVLALQEDGGGRYLSLFQAPKGAWQPVELSTGDFALAREPNDPKDPNGRLDLDKVNGVFVMDIAQLFAQAAPEAQKIFGISEGSRTLLLGDFTVSRRPILPRAVSRGSDVVIDSFAHPQISWLAPSSISLRKTSEKPLNELGMRADYMQEPGKPALLSTPLMPWILTSAKALSFNVASAEPVKLIVQVEENDGGKYNAQVDVPGGKTLKPVKLDFSSFVLAEDAKDPNGKLDLGEVKSLLFIDTYGFTVQSGSPVANTLWISDLMGRA